MGFDYIVLITRKGLAFCMFTSRATKPQENPFKAWKIWWFMRKNVKKCDLWEVPSGNLTVCYWKLPFIIWKQRCERPRFGQSPFATFLHESTHPEKNMAALVTSTLHLPQANPKNKIPYTKLNSITENRKSQKKNKDSRERFGGLIVAGSLFFFVFFRFLCCFGGFAYCTACL